MNPTVVYRSKSILPSAKNCSASVVLVSQALSLDSPKCAMPAEPICLSVTHRKHLILKANGQLMLLVFRVVRFNIFIVLGNTAFSIPHNITSKLYFFKFVNVLLKREDVPLQHIQQSLFVISSFIIR